MPAAISPETKAQVKASYFQGLSLADAAAKHGVSARAAQQWSASESWAKLKAAAQATPPAAQAPQLVSFDRARNDAIAVAAEVVGPIDTSAVQDLGAVLDRAIARIDQQLQAPYDVRSLGSLATALAKLAVTRRELADDMELLNELMRRFGGGRELLEALRAAGWLNKK